VVIEQGGALVEAARVRRAAKTEFLAIEMMAEFMAQRAQKRAEGSDLLANCRPGPNPDARIGKRVVSKKLNLPSSLANAKRAGCQRTNFRSLDTIECSRCMQEIGARALDLFARTVGHNGFNDLSEFPKP
jgi:hypothetical protein